LYHRDVDMHVADQEDCTPLWSASLNGHVPVVEFLLSHGGESDVNKPHRNGSTPLFVAAEGGHLKVVELLLAKQASTQACLHDETSMLYAACSSGHLAVVQRFYAEGASLISANQAGVTPLWAASSNGHQSVVEFLLDNGAKVTLEMSADDGSTPLLTAILNGHDKLFLKLLEAGANPQARLRDQSSALYLASIAGSIDMVASLIQQQNDVQAANVEGCTPLWGAACHGQVDVCRHLLKAGARVTLDLPSTSGFTPLLIAIKKKQLNIVELLVELGADMHKMTQDVNTALHLACEAGELEMMHLLLKAGLMHECKNAAGRTPFWLACSEGHTHMVADILENQGASWLDMADDLGDTPLSIAAKKNHFGVVSCLLKAGANQAVITRDDNILVNNVCQNGHASILKQLYHEGVDIHRSNQFGVTPLLGACIAGSYAAVAFLIEHGAKAELEKADHLGNTPESICDSVGRESIKSLLFKPAKSTNSEVATTLQAYDGKLAKVAVVSGLLEIEDTPKAVQTSTCCVLS
ncbi:hypothetical protein HOF26_01870, partial [bacterium]|nr:hypothetical protein [bacterium]